MTGDADGILQGGLADNGGPVQTIALVQGIDNPAIDKGAAQPDLTLDANGNPRAVDNADVNNGGTADAGAVEAPEALSLIVTTNADVVDAFDGVTSLREAVAFANASAGADTITFDLDPDDTTIRLTQGTLTVTDALTIDGGGVVTITGDVKGDDKVVAGVTDLASTGEAGLDDNIRLFELEGADTTFSGLTLTGGAAGNTGGAIISFNANVTVIDSTVSGNVAGGSGGGIFNYDGTNTVTNSTVSGNVAGGSGGGIYNFEGTNAVTNSTVSGNVAGDYGGGISSSDGTNAVTNSTVSGNEAGRDGGGIFNVIGENAVMNSTVSGNVAGEDGGGIFNNDGENTVTNSTVSGNVASDDGGGIYNYGGTNTVTNSTVSGNVAGSVGGGDGGGIFNSEGESIVTNSTVSGNVARDEGGGISSVFGANTVTDSIVAGNFAGTETDVYGVRTLTGGNIIGDTLSIGTTETVGITTDQIFAETVEVVVDGTDTGVLAGVLADNGGGVQTIALLADATNVALDAAATTSNTDARGFDRGVALTGDQHVANDLGAFELQADEAFDGPLVVNSTADGPINLLDDDLTLREALMVAGDGDTITFDANVFSDANFPTNGSTVNLQSTLVIENDVTIDGDTDGDGDADVILSGDANGDDDAFTAGSNGALVTNVAENEETGDNVLVFELGPGDVTLNGLVITGGFDEFGSGGGGVSSTSATSLTITNSLIAGNEGRNGGGIGSAGDLTLIDSEVLHNKATGQGGGIVSGGDLTLINSEVSHNGAARQGGGISSAGDLTLINSEVSHNEAIELGGGIFANSGGLGGTLTITDSTIVNNTAGSGGGVLSGVSVTMITGSTISDNSAGSVAGGLYARYGATIKGSTISDNVAEAQAGGILGLGNIVLTDTSVVGNTVETGDGGGIVSTGTLFLTSSLIHDNTSGGDGAGVYVVGNDNTFTNTTFTNNSADGFGGAIAVGFGGFTADHVTITGNQAMVDSVDATSSGAVFQDGSGPIEDDAGTINFTNSIVVGNSAGSDGSQFVIRDDTPTSSDGNNLIGNSDAESIFAETDTFETASGGFRFTFGVLDDNGGPVQTVALLADANNVALDNASGDGPATDARGRARSDFAGLGLGIADIGAFELVNAAPVVASSNFSVAEGQVAVGTVSASDDIDTGVAFSIAGGADAGLFTINAASGALAFADAPNFEAPADADGDNIYEVIVGANDGTSTGTQAFDVAVTDVAEAQTIIATPEGGTVTGSDEGDTVAGNTGNDVVNAGLGDDIIVDPGGDDIVNAGGGNDRIGLLSGMNTVSGGDGADLIVGGYGNDDLMGDAGMDVIRGDVSSNLSGSDRITGGTGDDLLEGRGGVDTFVFATGDGADTIGALDIDYVTPANSTVTGADFVSGVDVIELQGFDLADNDAALAAVRDVGGVATFAAEGTTITFAGLTADDLAADDFILV